MGGVARVEIIVDSSTMDAPDKQLFKKLLKTLTD
jgi:hypothetical protein